LPHESFFSLDFKSSFVDPLNQHLVIIMFVQVQSSPNRANALPGTASLPTLHEILSREIRNDVADAHIEFWDRGVFFNELMKQHLALGIKNNIAVDGIFTAGKGLVKGTYKGTQMALTELYRLIEEA
jgi:hypothetical protein